MLNTNEKGSECTRCGAPGAVKGPSTPSLLAVR